LRLLDQTRLPNEEAYLDCRSVAEVRDAICRLVVRGAPAIGVAAAYALVLERKAYATCPERAHDLFVDQLRSSRPPAGNLGWALDRMTRRFESWQANRQRQVHEDLLEEAHAIAAEDVAMCAAMGRFGAELIEDDSGVLTHCNTGCLATAGVGTA